MTEHESMWTFEGTRYMADIVVTRSPHERAGEILLVQRRYPPFRDCWALPGGRVEKGELPIVAAARELREETSLSLSVRALEFVDIWATRGRDPRGETVSYVYRARVSDSAEAKAGDDAANLRWASLNDLDYDKLAFDHAEIIQAAA